MNKLKFTKDEGSDFYKELTEKIEQYFSEKGISKTGNRIMIIKIILYFSMNILFYLLMITSTTTVSFYTFYLLMGLSVLLTILNISHDAAHGVAVKSKNWNKLLFLLSFNLQGINAYMWGKNHTESHHLYTNIDGSDIEVLNHPLIRMTEYQPLKWYHRYQFIYAPLFYLLYTLNWILINDTLMLFNYSSKSIKIMISKSEAIKLLIYKLLYIGYIIVLPIYLLPFGWTTVLSAFLINHFLNSIIFMGILGVSHVSNYVEHPVPDQYNKINISWPKLQLCTSVDYNADSKIFNWTLGGFNAHTLHHLLPTVCHVHYLNILPIFREIAKKHGLTYMEMSYVQSLASHFRFLKSMGTQKTFNSVPFKR